MININKTMIKFLKSILKNNCIPDEALSPQDQPLIWLALHN